MLASAAVLDCLEDHVSVGAVCRLRRLSREACHTIDGNVHRWRHLSRRIGWQRTRSSREEIVDGIVGAARRCRECGRTGGRPCFNGYALCLHCQRQPSGYFELVDRRFVRAYTRGIRACGKIYRIPTLSQRSILSLLVPARRTRAGMAVKLLYWRADVESLHMATMLGLSPDRA